MQLHGWKKYALGAASMAALVIAILLIGGWGTAAADQLFNVFVTNTSANPVPVSGTLTINNPPASPVPVNETNTDANGNIKVHEQGTVQVGGNVAVSNLPATQPVSGTVNVGNFPANFPAAPTTSVIASDVTTVEPGAFPQTVIIPVTDVSAYREVTVYATVNNVAAAPSQDGQACDVFTFNSVGHTFVVDDFKFGTTGHDLVKTYDPAPPNVLLDCANDLAVTAKITWMLVGRTG
jgi:hypothetical protein